MISEFYDKTVSTKRLSATTGTDNESYQTNLASVSCHIQPLDEGFLPDMSGSYGKNFLMFCEVVDIKQGDIVVDGSVEYLVEGVESLSFEGETHLELAIRKTS